MISGKHIVGDKALWALNVMLLENAPHVEYMDKGL